MGRAARALRLAAIAAAAPVALLVLWLGLVWPPPSWWRSHWPAETAFMELRSRQLAAIGDPAPRRYQPVPLDSMSTWLPRAATLAEDDAFFIHHGIDYHALREALGYRRPDFSWSEPRDRAELARAMEHAADRRGRMRGASTITQQLAKNLYLSPSRSPLRKLKEAAIAYRLEWALPKDRILALYLNVAELGTNLWGVEAASQRYFHRPAARLSMDEAALLVATLPHPLSSNPAYRPGRTLARAELILRHLRGEPVEVPVEEPADTLLPPPPIVPSIPVDTPTVPDTTRRRDTTRQRGDTTKP